MRVLGFLVLAIPLLPLASQAAPVTKSKPLADCAALLASIPDVSTSEESVVEDIQGGCRATNLTWAENSYLRYGVDEVTLLSPDLLRTFPTGKVFTAADLTLKGMRVMPQTNSPLQDYIIGLTMIRMDLRLAYTSDPAALTSDVSFEFSAGKLGRLALSAKLSDFDNTDVELSSFPEFTGTLDQLEVSLDDSGLFAAIIAPPLLSTLPPDQDPRPAIEIAQEGAISTLSALPETVIAPQSLAALTTLIRAFPNPEGSWTLAIDSDPGLALDHLATGHLPSLAIALPGTKITASDKPTVP